MPDKFIFHSAYKPTGDQPQAIEQLVESINRDYNHSSFIDNVLNGLLGIRPTDKALIIEPIVPDEWEYFCIEDVKWQGKNVSVIYDKTGERYNKGKGLAVYINGEKMAAADTLQKLEIAK